MALSGSFNTSNYSGRYVTFSWTATQDIANNTSTINWTLKGAGKAEWSTYTAGNFKVVIDGETVYSSSTRIDLKEGTLVASGSKTITHNADGTRSFSASAEAGIYYVAVNCSGSGSWVLDNIPRAAAMTSAPDFNDEENATIFYKNPAGTSVTKLMVCISLTGAVDDIEYREISRTGTSYTFNFTDAERKILRKATKNGNSRTVHFVLRTYFGDEILYNSAVRNFTVINAAPTINPTIVDIGEASTKLTGNPNSMIKHYNVLQYDVGAAAYKEATIVNQSITCGGRIVSTNGTGVLSYVNSNEFIFTATDSRNNTVTKSITLSMVDYIPLTCDVDAEITLTQADGTKAEIEFTVSGNYFNGSFGAVSNTLKLSYSLEYEGGGISINPLTIPESAFSNGTYSLTYKIPNELDYKKSYIIKLYAEDKIYTDVQSSSKTLKAVPVFDWGENDFNFNVPVKINGVEIDYIVEQGEKNGWFYRKWNSGAAECWYSAQVSGIDVGEYNMNGFYYCGSKGVNFPFTFKSVAYTNATGGSTGNMNIVRPFGFSNTNMTYIVMGNADVSSATVRINLEAKGKWR